MSYYFWATYRRKILDRLLKKNKGYYQGTVLDIGGRERGKFQKPKAETKKWIFADLEAKHKPDLVLDVCNMKSIEDRKIDVVNAIELFEHVKNPQKGIKECYRVLKKGGRMILSAPFLYPLHADPGDFQRWTKNQWQKELRKTGFTIEKLIIMGRYFTVLAEMKKAFLKSLPFPLREIGILLYPLCDLLAQLDNLQLIKKHPCLGKFHGGYFIIAKKAYGPRG